MAGHHLNYREIIPNQSIVRRWKDITVDTGAAQSTLQDITLPESAGGYSYRDSFRANSVTRHRFIYWKITRDVLELCEHSLDFDLHGNQLRVRFTDTPILDGVSVHETTNHVIVLIATVFSVHRLVFAHPCKLQQQRDFLRDRSHPSIFNDASVETGNDPKSQFVFELSNSSSALLPQTASSWLTTEGDAVFAVAGGHVDRVVIVRLPATNCDSQPSARELRCAGAIQRFWTGIIPASIRSTTGRDVTVSAVVLHSLDNDLFVYALTRDLKIRQFATSDFECLAVLDVCDVINERKNVTGSQNHALRKSTASGATSLYLGIFACLSSTRHVCVVRSASRHQLEPMTVVQLPECHLIDLTLTHNHIWALWTVGDGETSIHVTPIETESESRCERWSTVLAESPPEREVSGLALASLDPREAFMDSIFRPGGFSIASVCKAISIFRRSAEAPFFVNNTNASLCDLKGEVTSVVEKAVQMQASDYEMQDGDYFNLQLDCWSKFYSCCVQYQEVESKIQGIVVDHRTGIVCVVKKTHFSILRPQDAIEELMVTGSGYRVSPDVVKVVECLRAVHRHVREDVKMAFESELEKMVEPEVIVATLMESFLIVSTPEEAGFLREVAEATNCVGELVPAVEGLLAAVDLANGWSESTDDDEGNGFSADWLASDVGSGLVAKTIWQLARVRFDMCRDLMFYFHLLMKVVESSRIGAQVQRRIETELVPRTKLFLRSYYTLLWASETLSTAIPRTTFEAGLNQLALLDLTDTPKPEKTTARITSLVEQFVRTEGGTLARSLPFPGGESPFVRTAIAVAGLLWPLGDRFSFPEFLLARCQYSQLADYVALLGGWCEFNVASRYFLLGNVYLNLGEPDKSLDWFFAASECLAEDEFLMSKLAGRRSDHQTALTNFYLKVVHLLERFDLASQAIAVAKRAIACTGLDDDNLSTLWCIVFKHQLALGHDDEAYEAVVNNPCNNRTKDCLRQLVVVLCERKQFKTLVEFPYAGLQDDLIAILESRARSVDLTTHNFYDVLYSFHVYRGNYRKAGSVMYEYGTRLGHEVPGLKGLQRQAKCYLATLNCLGLVDRNYAWIVKSVVVEPEAKTEERVDASPKRDHEDNSVKTSTRRMSVLELDDIRKEYDLLHARLRLFRKEPEPSTVSGRLSTSETVGLLVAVGLFDAAVGLCRTFEMGLAPVFQGLAAKCVELSHNATEDAWEWLGENDLSRVHASGGSRADPADHAWALLERYLEDLEKTGQSRYHSCVATKLLSMGAPLPLWLTASYKKRNPSELLRLYLDYDLLEEASELSIDYIEAVLGSGKENFGFKESLHAPNSPVWVPYTLIDHLLQVLESMKSDPTCGDMNRKVTNKLDEYRKRVTFVSTEMVSAARERQNWTT